jgi:hypothetical protein
MGHFTQAGYLGEVTRAVHRHHAGGRPEHTGFMIATLNGGASAAG